MPARSTDIDLIPKMHNMKLLDERSDSKSKSKSQRKPQSSGNVEPDVVTCADAGKTLLTVGEIKTPFNHDLRVLSKLWETKNNRTVAGVKGKEWLGKLKLNKGFIH